MQILFFAKLYLLTIPVFFVVDLLWLGVVAKHFYRDHLAHLLSPDVNWTAAVSFYLIYIAGILYFAVAPALARESLGLALLNGALFGFFTYITYELTNMATLPKWPLKVVLVDTLWGVVLCASVAAGSYLLGRWLLGA
ncbi:hypothetical protein CKO25_05855 [Thiocapsa imhoffii]|uniref:DUF2177 family protein n=1 Tax=Thiocapsa imhoffii TaxID=382777 RepID=A0A9X0WGP1_9GAMM|nr:DUF2177 family protein [Thiocapsa imhoffii]MBK1644185.1 hypothetical protein [Thiocapsa imhoffii]